MNNELLWQSDIVDWEKISADSYKFVIEQANERLNEVLEESHSITRRGMTILLSHLTALSGILGYLFSDKSRINHERGLTIIFVCIMASLSIYAFDLLFRLIYPRILFYKGSPPKEIFFKEVFDGLSEEEGLRSILFDEVVRIQDRIERIEKENNKLSDRRGILKNFTGIGGKIALTALPFAIGSLFQKAYGAPSNTTVLNVLNFALILEYLESTFYQQGLAAPNLIPAGQQQQDIGTISAHEAEHVAFLHHRDPIGSDNFYRLVNLNSTLSKQAADWEQSPQGCVHPLFDLPVATVTFEDTGVRAYKGQAAVPRKRRSHPYCGAQHSFGRGAPCFPYPNNAQGQWFCHNKRFHTANIPLFIVFANPNYQDCLYLVSDTYRRHIGPRRPFRLSHNRRFYTTKILIFTPISKSNMVHN